MTDLNRVRPRKDRPRVIDDENQTPSPNESQNQVLLGAMAETSGESHGRVVIPNQLRFILIQIPTPHNFTPRKIILQFKTHAHNSSLPMLCSSYLPWSARLGPRAIHIQVLLRTPQPIATSANGRLISNMLHQPTITTHTHILMILTCLMPHCHPTLLTIIHRPNTPLPAEEPSFVEVDREVDESRLLSKKTIKVAMLWSCHPVLSVQDYRRVSIAANKGRRLRRPEQIRSLRPTPTVRKAQVEGAKPQDRP
jgi:hypothetical protein